MIKWKLKSTDNKYHNKPCTRDGMKFHSQAEAKYYDQLVHLKREGFVSFFLRQCPMHLTAGIKYVVDFVVFYTDGQVEFIDVKGQSTPLYIMKKKQVEHLYPIEIKEVHM
jgi:hypothetical protein